MSLLNKFSDPASRNNHADAPGQLGLYEAQERDSGHRMCGAAALVMAYRRQGRQFEQSQVWQQISHSHQGQFRAHTFHMAQHAIANGYATSIIQSHQPIELLKSCWVNNISVVLNHRLCADSDEGHYSFLVGIDQQFIWLHDPWLGPNTRYSLQEFLKLWLPAGSKSEIAGNVLIAIGKYENEPTVWAHCNTMMPATTPCPHCQSDIAVAPKFALGCSKPDCPQRLWYRLFCPACDGGIDRLQFCN